MMTIDGHTLDELGLAVLPDFEYPVAPPTRDHTMEIGGKHGLWDFGADMEPRSFNFPLIVKPQPTRGHVQQVINDLIPVFFDATGRPKTVKLVFDWEPDKYYRARYSGEVNTVRYHSMAKMEWPLVAFDPFRYAPSDQYDPDKAYQYDSGYEYDSGLMYANSVGFNWRYRKQYIGLYNYSSIETPIRIVVRGSVINPRITNQTTGKTLTVGAGLIDGSLEMDAEYYYSRGTKVKSREPKEKWFFLSPGFPIKYTEVEYTDEQYFLSGVNGDYPFLAPGLNSLLLEGGLPDALVTVEWEHKFM